MFSPHCLLRLPPRKTPALFACLPASVLPPRVAEASFGLGGLPRSQGACFGAFATDSSFGLWSILRARVILETGQKVAVTQPSDKQSCQRDTRGHAA